MTKELKKESINPLVNPQTKHQAADWKKEHNQKKFYDPITFKEIKIGYTGDLMDDENTPF